MKPDQIMSSTVADLVRAYRQAAIDHAAASASGRHRVANRNYDLLESIQAELRSRGPVGEAELQRMLEDELPEVRLSAASHAPASSSERAEAVLEELAAGPPSPLRLSADMLLRHKRTGGW